MLLDVAGARADELKGTVRGPSGHAVENADFDVYDTRTGAKLLESDNTDHAGRYRLTLPPGRYDVLCEPEFESGLAPRMVRAVVVSGSTTLDLALAAAVLVRGRVTDARDPDPLTNGVAGADLDFDRTDDGTRAPALGDATAADGSFECRVEAGSYTITVTPDPGTGLAPVRMFDRVVTFSEPLAFPLQRAVSLAGRIRDSEGAPVAGVAFKFDDALARRIPSAGSRSAADGSYRVSVAPGTYRVTVEPGTGGHCIAVRVSNVDMSVDRVQDFALARGIAVAGRVTDRMGRAVSGADWEAVSESTGERAFTPGDGSGADGRFRFVVAPGSYRLRVTPPSASGCDTVTFRNVTLARDTTLDVDYAARSGERGPGGSPLVRFAPERNPTRVGAAFALVLGTSVRSARVEIFDASGARVRELHRGPLPAGGRALAWDGRRREGAAAHTGVYFGRAERDGFVQVTRVILLP